MKLIRLVAAVIWGAVASTAQASPWTVTASGVLEQGYDSYGVFFNGVSQSSLTGQSFQLSITVDPKKYDVLHLNDPAWDPNLSYAYGANNPTAVSFTMNGIEKSWFLPTSGPNSQSKVYSLHSSGGAYQGVDTVSYDSSRILAEIFVQANSGGSGVGTTFDQNWYYQPIPGVDSQWMRFALGNSPDMWAYTSKLASISITHPTSVSSVPAPPAFILMLTALGLLGLTKRFRKADKQA